MTSKAAIISDHEPTREPSRRGSFYVTDQACNIATATRLTYRQRRDLERAAEVLGISLSGALRLAVLHFLDLRPEGQRRYAKTRGGGA